jgi:hypothetical protein
MAFKHLGILLVVSAGACVRTAPSPQHSYWLSSASRPYSPVVRFRVASETLQDSLLVTVDSGQIIVPGKDTPGGASDPPSRSLVGRRNSPCRLREAPQPTGS